MRFTHNPETQSSRSPTKPSLPGMAFFMRRISVGPAVPDRRFTVANVRHSRTWVAKKLKLARRLLAFFGSELAEDEAAQVVGDFAEAGGLELGPGQQTGHVESRH